MTTILLVEDSRELAVVIDRELEAAGYRVVRVDDGRAAIDAIDVEPPDLVVLDWMLPKLDGLDVLRELRQFSAIPVLMLTARGEEADRVIGLELGADDYLSKPFSMRELIARVRALLRRSHFLRQTIQADQSDDRARASYRGMTLDQEQHLATLHGRELELTPNEFALLHLLLRNPGRVFSRDYLIETVWADQFVGDRSVDNVVLRLRKKLGTEGDSIETVWGIGYRLRRSPGTKD